MTLSKKILTGAVLIGLTIGIALVVKTKSSEKNKLEYTTQKPIRHSIIQTITASGTLKAEDQLTVGSLEDGKVEKILVEDNDQVKKGQVLAILDNGIGDSAVKNLKAVLGEAKANLEYLEKFYKRQKQIYQAGQLAQDAFDKITKDYKVAQTKVAQTQASLEIEEKKYNNLFIKSPDDGIVISKQIDLGQMITSRLQATVLFVIAKNLQKMEAHVDVDEADVGHVKNGLPATFTVDSFPTRHFHSKVKRIQYLAKTVENVISYEALLDVQNQDLSLRPGMTTNVEITIEEQKNALCIPNKALRIDGKKLQEAATKAQKPFQALPPLEGNGKSKKQHKSAWIQEGISLKEVAITTGAHDERYTQVIGGIDENADIIIEFIPPKGENLLLKSMMGGASGGIGKK
ncbi:MAG: efflux RND transporter periplasmic adaptor subunit [bacterium]